MYLLDIRNLSIGFKTHAGYVSVLEDISLELREGEVFCLAGESGCGKTSIGLAVMGLLPENARIHGEIFYRQSNLLTMKKKALRRIRGRDIAMIFEQPGTCLNPVMKVGKQIEEIICLHKNCSRKTAKKKAIALMERMKIPSAGKRYEQYPHELSGGTRQRVMIAMALSGEPSLVIGDEPTTSVDVTIQAQIILLLKDVISELNTSFLLITHDLGVAAQIAHQVAILHNGRIEESGKFRSIMRHPQHAYTRSLIAAAANHYPAGLDELGQIEQR